MDFGETIYILLSFSIAEVETYLNGRYGKNTMYWCYETNEERLERIQAMELMHASVPLTEYALYTPPQVTAQCAITGQAGLCRQIILID